MSTPIITNGLVANWDVRNYQSGQSTWADSVGNLLLRFTSTPSVSGDGIEMNASITFQSDSISGLGLSDTLSLEWIGRIDAASFDNNSPGHIFGYGPTAGQYNESVHCYSKSSPNGIQIDADSSDTCTSGVYNTGRHHIILTQYMSGNWVRYAHLEFWVDGSQRDTYQDTLIDNNDALRNDKNYIYNNEGVGRFVGAVEAIRLWNRQLSDDEIAQAFTEVPDDACWLKQNGNWSKTAITYKKQNGVWTRQDDLSALCDADMKYLN